MRTIKFRFWDVPNNKMRSYEDVRLSTCNMSALFEHADSKIAGWIPMQFTGLLDKSGKEIYEGDIVRIYEHEFSPMEFVVNWSEVNLCWGFDSVTKDNDGVPVKWFDYSSLNGFESDSEVIGNIYELINNQKEK